MNRDNTIDALLKNADKLCNELQENNLSTQEAKKRKNSLIRNINETINRLEEKEGSITTYSRY